MLPRILLPLMLAAGFVTACRERRALSGRTRLIADGATRWVSAEAIPREIECYRRKVFPMNMRQTFNPLHPAASDSG
jgi:hypothetical protein